MFYDLPIGEFLCEQSLFFNSRMAMNWYRLNSNSIPLVLLLLPAEAQMHHLSRQM